MLCLFLFRLFSSCSEWARRRQWHPSPVLLPGKSMDRGAWWAAVHGVMTEQLHFHFSFSCIGEGNGNPLQCSCLENPRDGGAWWAAVRGVAQSRTQLKRLSSDLEAAAAAIGLLSSCGMWASHSVNKRLLLL